MKKIEVLRDLVRHGGVREIDSALNDVAALGGEDRPADFLLLLSDSAADDIAMFSIIHAAESCENDLYIKAVLEVMPALSLISPRWSSIVLMRIINNEVAKREFIVKLREASPEVKQVVRVLCEKINQVDLGFLSKTIPIIIAAS